MASTKEQYVSELAERLYVAIAASVHGVSGYHSPYKNVAEMAQRAISLAETFAEECSVYLGFERNHEGVQP